jgi:hypothetical protein
MKRVLLSVFIASPFLLFSEAPPSAGQVSTHGPTVTSSMTSEGWTVPQSSS